MPLKLNLGLSKKIGLPHYSSVGASCHVEVELENSLLEQNLERFQQHVRRAYMACAQAVHEELDRQQGRGSTTVAAAAPADDASVVAGDAQAAGQEDGASRATARQLDYARQLASQIRGLGIRRLEGLASTMFSRPLAELSMSDASELIRVLQEIRPGKVELQTTLSGAVP